MPMELSTPMELSMPMIPLPLPNIAELESRAVLKKSAEAHRYLAELKGVAASIPNEEILINTLSLQEAKNSSEIENIITTHDDLYRANPAQAELDRHARSPAFLHDQHPRGLAVGVTHRRRREQRARVRSL